MGRFVSGVVAHRTLKRDRPLRYQDALKTELAELRSRRDRLLCEMAALKDRRQERGAQSGVWGRKGKGKECAIRTTSDCNRTGDHGRRAGAGTQALW